MSNSNPLKTSQLRAAAQLRSHRMTRNVDGQGMLSVGPLPRSSAIGSSGHFLCMLRTMSSAKQYVPLLPPSIASDTFLVLHCMDRRVSYLAVVDIACSGILSYLGWSRADQGCSAQYLEALALLNYNRLSQLEYGPDSCESSGTDNSEL